MRAVVVYESMYGNTHLIADAIGRGLGSDLDATVVSADRVDDDLLAGADLVVVGGPTHVHGMSRASTRRSAVEDAHKHERDLAVDPDAEGDGLRELFETVGRLPARAAAFDTRLRHARGHHRPGVERHCTPSPQARLRAGRRTGKLLRDQGEPARGRRRGACTRLGYEHRRTAAIRFSRDAVALGGRARSLTGATRRREGARRFRQPANSRRAHPRRRGGAAPRGCARTRPRRTPPPTAA